MGHTLETPDTPELLYLAQGTEEVDKNRPLFTGDIYSNALNDNDPAMMIVLQHPCSLRVDGSELEAQLLMAHLVPTHAHRSNWQNHTYTQMPLPRLFETEIKYAVSFRHLDLFEPETLMRNYERIVTLSSYGINLLLQRWIFQNSRVIIPTMTFEEQISGPYNEADLEAEWITELEETSAGNSRSFHEWIRGKVDGGGPRRQDMLEDPQKRASVRRAMIKEIDMLFLKSHPDVDS